MEIYIFNRFLKSTKQKLINNPLLLSNRIMMDCYDFIHL